MPAVELVVNLFFQVAVVLGVAMLMQPTVFQRVVVQPVVSPAVPIETMSPIVEHTPCVCDVVSEKDCPVVEPREVITNAFSSLDDANVKLIPFAVNQVAMFLALSSLDEHYVRAKALEYCVENALQLKLTKEALVDGCAKPLVKSLMQEVQQNRTLSLADVDFVPATPAPIPAPQEPLVKPYVEPLVKPYVEPEPVVKRAAEPVVAKTEAPPAARETKRESDTKRIDFPAGKTVLFADDGYVVHVRIPLQAGPVYALTFDVRTQTLSGAVESFCKAMSLSSYEELVSCFKTVSVYVREQLIAAGLTVADEQPAKAETVTETEAVQSETAAAVDVSAAESVSESVSESEPVVAEPVATESVAEVVAETESEIAVEPEAVELENVVETQSERETESIEESVSAEESAAVETEAEREIKVESESVAAAVEEQPVTESERETERELRGAVQLGSQRVSLSLAASLSLEENAQRFCSAHFAASLSRLVAQQGLAGWTEDNCAALLAEEMKQSFVADEQ